jgi:hypothetical protein
LEVWNAYPASVLTAFQDRGVPVQIILAGMKLDTYESQGLVRAEVERIDEGGTVPDPKERSFFAAEGTYLIITGNDYYDPQTSDDPSKIKELGEWKRRKGYYVITQRMYDIVGTGDADSEDIHTLIRHVYNHDPGYEGIPDLRYVLIVGQAPYHLDTIDPDTWSMMYSVNQGMAAYSVPSPSVYHEGSKRNVFADTFYTKGFYAIASDFDYSGVTIGRLAVKTTDQCRNAITKILRYDKGATGETDNWYGRALVLSYFEETTQNSGQESSSAYAESALTQYAALSAPGVLDESLRYNKDLDLWNRAPRFITGVWKALEGRSSFQFRQNKGGTWASEVLGWDDSYDDSWGFLNPAPNWVSNLDSAGQGGTLSIPMEETQDTIPLQTGGGAVFPSTFPYLVIVDSEFCRVTGKTDDTLTVERSQVPQEHEAGTFVQWPVILAAYMTDYTDTAELLGGGGCFPADFPYLIRIGNEICSVTDKNGDVLSLDRGTSPIAHATGTIVTFIGRRPFVSGFVDCVNDARKDASIDGEINAGVGLILHFDHGMEQSLAYLNYTTFHPQTYTNGYKTPLMMSMACADGTLREDCFGATFIHGFDGIRGGVGFLGSDGFGSGSNAMAPGFLMALFGRKISPSKWDDAGLSDMTSTEQDVAITWRPAQALLLGRILGRVDNWDHYNFQGDPETMLRTHIPDTLDLTDPPPSWSGQAAVRNLDVTVKWASGLRAGSPVYGALVSLTRASIQRPWVGFTDHSGHATIIVDTTEGSGVYDLVATSHDAVAYESQTQP